MKALVSLSFHIMLSFCPSFHIVLSYDRPEMSEQTNNQNGYLVLSIPRISLSPLSLLSFRVDSFFALAKIPRNAKSFFPFFFFLWAHGQMGWHG